MGKKEEKKSISERRYPKYNARDIYCYLYICNRGLSAICIECRIDSNLLVKRAVRDFSNICYTLLVRKWHININMTLPSHAEVSWAPAVYLPATVIT